MKEIDIDKISEEVIESISNMSADEVKKLMLNCQEESIENVKEEFKKSQEIYKFLENKDFDFLERVIILSLIMIKTIIKGDDKNV